MSNQSENQSMETNQSANDNQTDHSEQQEKVISAWQSCAMIASSLIGVGVLTLPRVTASEAREAAWITTIIGSFIAILAIVVITRLGFRFPYKSILEYSSIILGPKNKKHSLIGKLFSIPLILCLIGYYLIVTASIARTFGEVVVTTVLRETPIEVIIGTMLLTSLLLVLHKVEVLARVNEVLFPIIVIPVLLIALFSYQSFQLEFILPIWPDLSLQEFLMGIILTFFTYQGYEVMLVYSPYVKVTKKTLSRNVWGILIPAFTYILIIIAGVSVFGNEELAQLMWPTLELVKVTQFPGLILERMESAFLGVWVAAVFTTVVNFHYAASLLTSKLFKKDYRRWIGTAALPFIFWISLMPQNVLALFELQMYIGYLGVLFGIVIPFILLVIAKLRKLGHRDIQYEENTEDNSGNETKAKTEGVSP